MNSSGFKIVCNELEAFHKELSAAYYMNACRGERLIIAPIYAKYNQLFNFAVIEGLSEYIEKSNSESDRRKGEYVRKEVINQYLRDACKGVDEQLENCKVQRNIDFNQEKVSYYELNQKYELCENKKEQQQIDNLKKRFLKKFYNPVFLSKIQIKNEISAKLGFKNYVDLRNDLDGINSTFSVAKLLLEVTTEAYKTLRREYEKIKPKASIDKPRWEEIIPTVKQTFLDLGINLVKQKNIKIPRQNNRNRAYISQCFLIDVPNDIRIVFRIFDGLESLKSVLHEVAHAEHYAHTDSNLEFPFKKLGSYETTEAYAFLFESLLKNKNWISIHLGLEIDSQEANDTILIRNLSNLLLLRETCMYCIFEKKLYEGLENPGQVYQELLNKTWARDKGDQKEEYFSLYGTLDFMSYDHLKGKILCRSLEKYMKNNFGEKWFKNKEAETFLKTKLWKYGNMKNKEEIAQIIGLNNPALKNKDQAIYTDLSGY